ncbi:MAG: transcription-repair coupling factor [Chloroflexi bacterium]|nr:transcription-repair coupling factor [Chloroflexota bacterium]MCY4247203.1 transcription-repair coupling factor [Chloroflexota bacterium]
MTLQLAGLLELVRGSFVYQELVAGLDNGSLGKEINVTRAARPCLLAALVGDWGGPIIYLTTTARRAYNVSEQLPIWLADASRLHRFAEPSAQFYDYAAWDAGVIRSRIAVLDALARSSIKTPPIIVASARALIQGSIPPDRFRDHTITLRVGQRHRMDALISRWLGMGYEPATVVLDPGTFSRRGGILDIFPLASEQPLRIDFFDDEIDSLRRFDPGSQRSNAKLLSARIVPAREALPVDSRAAGARLQTWAKARTDDADDFSNISADISALAQGSAFACLEHYLPYLYRSPACLLDHAPDNCLVIIEEADQLEQACADLAEDAEVNRVDALSSLQIAPRHPRPYLDWPAVRASLGKLPQFALGSFGGGESPTLFAPSERFGGQLRLMLTQLRSYSQRGERIVILSEQVDRLGTLWAEQDASTFVATVAQINAPPAPGSLRFVRGAATEGWTLPGADGGLRFITDAEIFGWSRPEPRRRLDVKRRRAPDTRYADWEHGAYVVHVDFGIGRFAGLQHRSIRDSRREYLMVEYQNADTIYVPIHQADRLSRYVGADGKAPKLSQLGKADLWLKAREKARRNAEAEAKELLNIYSRRATAQGHAFSPDSAWQHEMEAAFPFVETEDQLRVIEQVKGDMSASKPMDRLVCGDVGFGKTEVALRAAFKAVQDGVQVAVLVPTTVLAQQHYDNFKARLAAFPVCVEMMSRFRTKAQQRQIATGLANSEVDIIIGTHRLLSDDIHFKNLGLMIIDEEQRFGVKHKEHFKKLRARIDILTLTATPIPRTLYLSLSGIRDISMIQTPPEERLPVITQVGAWDDKLSRMAIRRELDRGGQVFVVHNRIRSIYGLRDQLERLAPEASVAVAHGQMPARALEAVMADFAHGEYDILLSTAIIENGIDMPRVNTLVVDRADTFGVSQLYQLRGRVGRSAQQAYAYFFHSPGSLTEEARARLETLAENTQLGAGFQIAVRDLEMRGSGDILSMQQTGHVASVGLHLYTEMLQQAILEQRGDAPPNEAAPASARERIIIDLPLPAYLPTDWIPEMALRLQLYRRIGNIAQLDEVDAMRDELIDRFGALPAAVEGLLVQIRVKALAQELRATHVQLRRGQIHIKLPYLATLKRDLLEIVLGEEIEVTRTELRLPATADWQARLLRLLAMLKERVRLVGGV